LSPISRIRKIVFGFSATVIILMIAEVVVRIGGWGTLPSEKIFTDVYNPTYTMLPMAANPWAETDEYLNQIGLRGQGIDRQRKPGVIRIICAGDSTTFGSGVKENETYAYYLQQLLQERGIVAEVLNAGVPGTTLWQQRMLIEERLAAFSPDLIFLYTGPNFTRQDLFRMRRLMERGSWTMQWQRILAHSRLYRLLRLQVSPPELDQSYHQYVQEWRDPTGTTIQPEWFIKDAEEDLTRLKSLGQKIHCRVVVINVIPRLLVEKAQAKGWHSDSPGLSEFYYQENVPTIVRIIADRLGLDTISIEPTFIDASYTQNLFQDVVHFTPAGHQLMAAILEEEICKRNWLPVPCQ